MANHKTELEAVFEDMDLDMIHQAMELFGSSPPPRATLSLSCSSTSESSSASSVALNEPDLAIDRPPGSAQQRKNQEHVVKRTSNCESYGDHHAECYINLLPPELLGLIFTYCIDVDPDIIPTLSQVCWSWYDVTTTTSSLWQHISLSDAVPFSPRILRRKVELWTKRSGSLPVDFEMRSERRDTVLPMLSYLAGSAERLRLGTMVGRMIMKRVRCRFERTFGGEDAKKGGPTSLRNLKIELVPASEYASDFYAPFETDLGEASSPTPDQSVKYDFSLPWLRLSHISVREVCQLPPAETLAPFWTVTKLSIHNMSEDMEMPIHNVVQALKAFPVLEELDIGNLLSQDPRHPGDERCYSMKPVILPRLRFLSIMSICSLRCFLSNITTPALTNLSLIHLNTSTLYETELPGEPGDSDDEMHDFSQSPWTDHATGMGLRSLFSRCTPPLRVLIMDYADMRTKDFTWVFRTFTDLEHLQIVASDMSDNVARALEPDASRKWYPLPRLKAFSITHCQKVGGRAFLRMVERRLDAAERGEVRRLEKVGVVDCMGFTGEDLGVLEGWMEESRKTAVREEMKREMEGEGEGEMRLDIGTEMRMALTSGWMFPEV